MFHPRMRSFLRRGLAAAAMIGFALASLGVSWTVAPRKDRSVPFPCMDRGCGCHDAAGCKKHCCCFSDTEKLAWAATHGVDPAPFVSETAVSETAVLPTARRQHRSCCERDGQCPLPFRETARVSAVGRNALVRATLAPTLSRRERERKEAHETLHLVSISAQRQCHGLAQLWSILAAALPPVRTSPYEFDWVCAGMVAEHTASPIRRQISPPTPPPRG
jgi:hypothetical protein